MAKKGNFIEYVVSDNPNKYPNSGEQGGYYYEKVIKVETEAEDTTSFTGNNENLQNIKTNAIN